MRAAPQKNRGSLPFLPIGLRVEHRADDSALTSTVPPLVSHKNKQLFEPILGENDDLQCIETEYDQYSVRNAWEACWRVFIHNPPYGTKLQKERILRRRNKESLLGKYGHIERMNAWTHIIGAAIFAVYSAIRPATDLDSTSISGRLSAVSSAIIVVVFGVSTTYHTYGSVRWMAPFLRMLDHGSIYVSLGVATMADTALVTLDFNRVLWQTVVDGVLVAIILICFFSYRRMVLDPSFTEIAWGDCRLGLFRFQHADYGHASLRSAGYVVLSFSFVLLIPTAHQNLSSSAFWVLLACNGMSLAMLVFGLILDNVLLLPDAVYEDWAKRPGKSTKLNSVPCHSKSCGCVMSSHAWWHTLSLISVIVQTAGREYALGVTNLS